MVHSISKDSNTSSMKFQGPVKINLGGKIICLIARGNVFKKISVCVLSRHNYVSTIRVSVDCTFTSTVMIFYVLILTEKWWLWVIYIWIPLVIHERSTFVFINHFILLFFCEFSTCVTWKFFSCLLWFFL